MAYQDLQKDIEDHEHAEVLMSSGNIKENSLDPYESPYRKFFDLSRPSKSKVSSKDIEDKKNIIIDDNLNEELKKAKKNRDKSG